MAVHAMASAPSWRAASADSVMQAAANSGWWLTEPAASMATRGWMVGTASETLAMSVDKVGRGEPSSSRSKRRPSASALHPVEIEQSLVALHVRVHRGEVDAVEPAPGGERPRLEARHDPWLEGRQAGERGGSAHEPTGHRLGDDVGGLATAGHDAVDLVPGTELLAEQPDGHLGDGHGVAGVDPLARGGGGVRRSCPLKCTSKWETARQVPLQALGRPGVDHQRRVHAVEDAPLEHEDLAAAALLGRCAEHLDGDAEVVGDAGQRRGRHRPRRRR